MLFLPKKVFCLGHGPWGQIFFRSTRFQLNLLILIESSNIFHWKPAKNVKVGVDLRQSLGQIRSNVVKKVKKQTLSMFFFIFTWGKTWLYKHLSGNLRKI